MYFEAAVLHCHQKMQKERSISATYYLLQGKPSIQTIQDGQIYQLNQYFGLYKQLAKDRFFQIIQHLLERRLLEKQNGENYFHITKLGENFIEQHRIRPNYLQGDKYRNIDQLFFQRILLLVQVFTNSKMNHMKFLPIIENRDVERWVKIFYQKWKQRSAHVLKTLHDEFINILSPLDDIYAEIFVDQLTGYQRIGLTVEQIAHRYKMSVESAYLLHVNTLHYMLQTIETDKKDYPLLHTVCKDLLQQSSLTKSTKLTKRLLDIGYSLHEVATKRRLRLNTIYDHVVEIALKERNFPISQFVPEEVEKEIVRAVTNLQTYKLKDIKKAVADEISYFQIRLVLAKIDQLMKESGS